MGDIADEHRERYFDWLAGRYDDDCFEDQANPAEDLIDAQLDFPEPPPVWPPAK